MSINESAAPDPQPSLGGATVIEIFHYDKDRRSFEDMGNDNGFRYWFASDLSKCLDYDDYDTFRKTINRAIAACVTLNIPFEDNFVAIKRTVNGKEINDFKLSRFACYLAAMNGDNKKPKVAQAQVYFVVMAESFRQYLLDANEIERLNIRDEITDREKGLSRTAKSAGVTEYALFQNAGYRGLYNMNLKQLKQHKGLQKDGRTLLDFMGKRELAANLFRITETDAKIKSEGVHGQLSCEKAAESVGKIVRAAMLKTGGTAPENLKLTRDIRESRKGLKAASSGFKKLDAKKKKKN